MSIRRPARVVGMAAALAVAAFMLVLVGEAEPAAAGVGIAYIVAGAAVLLAPRALAAAAAIVTAVVTGLLVLVAGAMNPADGVILAAATLAEAWAAWDLVRHPDPPPPEDG